MISRRAPRRRRWLPQATALGVLVVLVAAVGLIRVATMPGTSLPAGQPASPTAIASAPVRVAADPAAVLRRIAAELTTGAPDPPPARYEYVERVAWQTGTGSPGGQPGRRIQFWTTGHGTSRTAIVDEAQGCPPLQDESGHDLGPFDGSLSSAPDALRRQILGEPLPPGAVPDIFGQVSELFGNRYVRQATRRGVLLMLSHQPGIRVQPAVTDRLGRSGIAVTWIYRPPMPFTSTKTLIFDPRTGQLLASHSQNHPTPDAPPSTLSTEEGYLLFVAHTYTPNTRTPAIRCT